MREPGEIMSPFETRLASLVGGLADRAARPFDAGNIARRAMSSGARDRALPTPWWWPRVRLVVILALVAGVVLAGLILASGSRPDPGRILLTRGGNIVSLDPRTGSEANLGPGEVPVWSPDRRSIAFTRDFELWAMNADGSRRRALALGMWQVPGAWSPDGRFILTAHVGEDSSRFLVVPADGGTPRDLGVSPWKDAGNGDWSPEGDAVAVVTSNGLFTVSVDGQRATHRVSNASIPWQVTWAPGLPWIAFDSRSGIHVIGRDGRGDRPLVPFAGFATSLRWAPDGGSLAFAHRGSNEVGLVEVGSGHRSAVFHGPDESEVMAVSWSGDGSELAVLLRPKPETRPDDAELWVVAIRSGTARRIAEADPFWIDW